MSALCGIYSALLVKNNRNDRHTSYAYIMTVSAQETIPSHHRFLYKPVENCETDGCHIDVWLPEDVEALSKNAGIPLASKRCVI